MTSLRSFTLLVSLFSAAGVDAATFCASSETDLVNALSAAQSNGVDDEIRIRSGVIVRPGQQLVAFRNTMSGSESLSISGGWTGSPGQCTAQSASASLTVLDGNDTARVLEIFRDTSSSGSFTLRNMTLRRGKNAEYGACLAMRGLDATVTGENLVENLIITGCTNGVGAGMHILPRLGTTTLRNVLLRDNASPSVSALYLRAEGTVYVSNMTIVDNVTTTPNNAARFETAEGGAIFASNNIVWNNVGGGMTRGELELDGANVTLVRNLYGTISGDAPTVLSNNNLRVDPQFAADGVRLLASSRARDAGTNSPLGGANPVDLDGRARVQGTRMDIGAFEIPVVFDDGFE